MLADVAFDPVRPSPRWLLLLSLLAHALALAAVLEVQSRPARVPYVPQVAVWFMRPPAAPRQVCRTWVLHGDSEVCRSYFTIAPEPVQFTCSELSPELRRALRTWPYQTDPCAR
jgi:hypothetical protein